MRVRRIESVDTTESFGETMRIDIETVNPVIDSEYRCKTQIEIDDMR